MRYTPIHLGMRFNLDLEAKGCQQQGVSLSPRLRERRPCGNRGLLRMQMPRRLILVSSMPEGTGLVDNSARLPSFPR
jgi:hypothetical protein